MTRLLTLSAALLIVAPATAQVSVDVDANRDRTTTRDRDYSDRSKANDKMEPLRASELIGHSIVNGKDETLGSIEDIVLDRNDGSVKYVAVSMGGFLGLGDKLFAVPYKELQCQRQDGEHVITLDVTKEQLEDAKGFDQDNWPDMANKQWQMNNDRVYDSGRQGSRATNRGATR